jgi:ornithine cyclodeaminase/alanine dehydrogenase-like protein (mu-crystallin family)
MGPGTLLLNRREVADLLSIEECIVAVESAFRWHGEGKAIPPKVLGIHTDAGGFHIKAGMLALSRHYFVAKLNANFPDNKRNNLPTIQGIIVVSDASDGRLLAIMDSIEITIIRTGAATAVAAKYLAPVDVKTITICGCGNQGIISIKALMKVRSLERVFAFDIDEVQQRRFIREFARELEVIPIVPKELSTALRSSEIIVTCTPSRQPFIAVQDIMPGAFIAAVGADSEEKQELFPDLLASNKVVADLVEQSATIGELHHAIQEKKMTAAAIHAELGMIIAGKRPGRESEDEIIIFDSTGMALQDVAAASIVYEKALEKKMGTMHNFSEYAKNNHSVPNNHRDDDALKLWYPFR